MVNNKHSNDTNERILQILTETSKGNKTLKQARKELTYQHSNNLIKKYKT